MGVPTYDAHPPAAAATECWLRATIDLTRDLMLAPASANPFATLSNHAIVAARATRALTVINADSGDALATALDDGSGTIQRLPAPLFTELMTSVPRSAAHVDAQLISAAQLQDGPMLAVPLNAEDGAFGVLVITRNPGEVAFTEQDLQLATVFASHAALAIEHVQDHQSRQMQAVHDDRIRIASNLHDLVIQHLFGVGLRLQALASRIQPDDAAAEVDSFVDQIDDTIRDIRRSIFALHQPIDDTIGLRSRILNVVTATPFSFEPRVYFNGPVDSAIPVAVHEPILVSLNEILANVVRHARAHMVDVVIAADLSGQRAVLTVTDDGVGWSGPAIDGSGTGNLAQRARALGGDCRFLSAKGSGTQVEWWVALHDDDAEPSTPVTSATAPEPIA